jgi:hypothetical protein
MPAFDHRGRALHAGKVTDDMNKNIGRSDLPRLSRILANYFNESAMSLHEDYDWYADNDMPAPMDYGPVEEFHSKHSLPSYYPGGGDRVPVTNDDDISEYHTQQMLDRYRAARNRGEDVTLAKEDLNEAIRNRSDYDY